MILIGDVLGWLPGVEMEVSSDAASSTMHPLRPACSCWRGLLPNLWRARRHARAERADADGSQCADADGFDATSGRRQRADADGPAASATAGRVCATI